MDKWDTLKSWLQLHAALESDISAKMVVDYMEDLEDEEIRFAKQLANEGFLFTGVPTFDQKAWEEIQKEKGLQGLA